MARYVGGHFDSKEIVTSYDHLPIIALYYEVWPTNRLCDMKQYVAYYELRNGVRHHRENSDYPAHGPIKEPQRQSNQQDPAGCR